MTQAFIENVFLTFNLALIVCGFVGIGWVIATTELTLGKGILFFLILLAMGSIHVSYKSPDKTTKTSVSTLVEEDTVKKLENK